MDEQSEPVGHVYPVGERPFVGLEADEVYRERNALLVEALRSGEFTRAEGALEVVRRENRFAVEKKGNCCLGGCLSCCRCLSTPLHCSQYADGSPYRLWYQVLDERRGACHLGDCCWVSTSTGARVVWLEKLKPNAPLSRRGEFAGRHAERPCPYGLCWYR